MKNSNVIKRNITIVLIILVIAIVGVFIGEEDILSNFNSRVFNTTYILNTNSKKFHRKSCPSVKEMNALNRIEYSENRKDVINKGYVPCKRCNP